MGGSVLVYILQMGEIGERGWVSSFESTPRWITKCAFVVVFLRKWALGEVTEK